MQECGSSQLRPIGTPAHLEERVLDGRGGLPQGTFLNLQVWNYKYDHPHRALRLEMPIPRPPTPTGTVVSRRVLGGYTMPTPGRLELGWDSAL